MVGTVVGMVGSGVEGNGGRVTFGAVGNVGSVNLAKMEFGWLVKEAMLALEELANVGNGVEGSGGRVALGREGIEGNGGKVAFGRGGIVGKDNAGGGAAAGVSKRWRAAWLICKLDKHNATTSKDNMKQCLKGTAIVASFFKDCGQLLRIIEIEVCRNLSEFLKQGLVLKFFQVSTIVANCKAIDLKIH
ncbi:hypothetical protein JRO89_XS08G0244200 [Xanthoceras sorbifolium]|uniref:Uncharacterized protein n=1 Tax=Xanthoceras sorbifolium TaxID=99658 RepID=A0ABQ8HRB0_9ROSI|nr:hypothetical protein JRO89_XS08G0244200 [Xanthoceras sorbifolium]